MLAEAGQIDWWNLYHGVPPVFQVFFWVCLAITISSALSVSFLLWNAGRLSVELDEVAHDEDALGADDYLWIFMVPALNEEVTISDSVNRLQQVRARHKICLVINDGSDDRTGEILAGIDSPELYVHTRVAPNARTGKGAALNDAFWLLQNRVLAEKGYGDWPLDRIIVGIIDADGRLSVDAPAVVARNFADASVGGVQIKVSIYNRAAPLALAQDIEFSTFGLVFQAGRARLGTANMGGCGQFNRLTALASVATAQGPWRDTLTEDLDLGLRLIHAGWRGSHSNDAVIEQQGLTSFRRLFRQRVRWAQGNWQALVLIGAALRNKQAPLAKVESIHFLLTPILQLTTGLGVVSSVFLMILGYAPYWATNPVILGLFVSLSFGPGFIALWLRGNDWKHRVNAFALVMPYTVYSWMIYPVLAWALIRELRGYHSWAKTEREAIPVVVGGD